MRSWDILIATVGQRERQFTELMAHLLPQVELARGAVRVTALWNHGERSIGAVRQDLLDSATGEYVSFIDDDDWVPNDFVGSVRWQLDHHTPDYVGWRLQCYQDGQPLKPTIHSIRYDNWHDDDDAYYRDISHLNPIRRTIAQQVRYPDVTEFEDRLWAARVRPLVRTERFIDYVMYYYRASSVHSTWGRNAAPIRRVGRRVDIDSRWFTYHPNSSSEE